MEREPITGFWWRHATQLDFVVVNFVQTRRNCRQLSATQSIPPSSSVFFWHYSRLVLLSVRLSSGSGTNRAFLVVGPRIWNDLPADVTSAESLFIFRQRLKTHLYKIISRLFPGRQITFLDINYLFSGPYYNITQAMHFKHFGLIDSFIDAKRVETVALCRRHWCKCIGLKESCP